MKRNTENIEKLIEKYFEGLTSLKEEDLLRRYFQGKNIREEWEIYRPMFQFFAAGRKRKHRLRFSAFFGNGRGRSMLAVAAGLLLLLALKFTLNTYKASPEISQTFIDGKKYTDIELIRKEALHALENLSESSDAVFSSQIEALDILFENN
jgi:hypothetical protein